MNYSSFLSDTLKIVSTIATEKFGHVSSTTKPDDPNQVLTEADLLIGKAIIEKIKTVYQTHNIIDEEAGVIDNGSEFTWVIDPIDGTSNFAARSPLYGIMVGLLKNSTPIAAGVSLPAFSEIYTAEKGNGTWCNGEKISVNKADDLTTVLVAYNMDGHYEDPSKTKNEAELLADIALHVRNIRSSNSVFDYCLVAKGSYGGVMGQSSRIWDNVAPHLLIEEAGGFYTDFFGKSIDYADPLTKVKMNFNYCAGAPVFHNQLQEIIRKGYKS